MEGGVDQELQIILRMVSLARKPPSQFEAHPREPSFSMGVRDTNLEQDHFPQLWISLLPLQLVSGKPANFRSAPARLPTVAPCLAPTTRPQRRSQIASGR